MHKRHIHSLNIREVSDNAKRELKAKATSKKAWQLEKQGSSLAPPGVWTNRDNDVTPPSNRTWTVYTVLGFWFSDALNIQGWEAPSSVISVGLTYKEAIYTNVVGMLIIAVPLVLNGAIGSTLHIPYPVAARSGFGYGFSKFAIVVRLVTALFWHSIQTYTGSYALTLCIAAIWPSYLRIPNRIPESMGVTTQQMVSQLLFWLIQLPILMIRPHKLKWFFFMKALMVSSCCLGVAIGMCTKAGSTGEIFNQTYAVSGPARSWLIMSSIMSNSGGWATMATNIPDFTRYVKSGNAQWYQALFLPVISTYVGVMGILSTSASQVLYGSFIWDPTRLGLQWTGPGGRAAMFFVGLSWTIGQIGTNLSANVITASNDLTSLFPRYINIRRGAFIVTLIAGWIMQPWKIISSAQSLLTFMSGLAIFLAPIAAIQATDFWLVKKKKVDVPGLYDPYGRYRYWRGINFRAVFALLVGLVPNIPGLAHAVNGKVELPQGILHLYDMNYLYGFFVTSFTYYVVNRIWPHKESLIEESIFADDLIFGDSVEDTVEETQPVYFTEKE